MCPNHTQFNIPGGILLNEWSARRRCSYLHNTLHTRNTRDEHPSLSTIRTRNASNQAAAGQHRRPHDHRDRRVVKLHLSRDRPNWSPLSFLSTKFKNFPDISDLLSEVSNFQHHTQLLPKCSILLTCPLNLNPFCPRRDSAWWEQLLPWQSWI